MAVSFQCMTKSTTIKKKRKKKEDSHTQKKRHGFNPWVGKMPGGGNGDPLQDSCLENLMDRGAWQAPVQRVRFQRTPTTEPEHKSTGF